MRGPLGGGLLRAKIGSCTNAGRDEGRVSQSPADAMLMVRRGIRSKCRRRPDPIAYWSVWDV